MATRYLAYGSNLHTLRLRERVASARLIGTTSVTGWCLAFNKRGQDGSGKCTIVQGDGSLLAAVYEISRADRTRLDAIEGVGEGYLPHVVNVPEFGECSTYIAEAAYIDDALLPFCWYRNLVLAGAISHGADKHYLARIRLLRIRVDANAQRREQNERLVERLYRHHTDEPPP